MTVAPVLRRRSCRPDAVRTASSARGRRASGVRCGCAAPASAPHPARSATRSNRSTPPCWPASSRVARVGRRGGTTRCSRRSTRFRVPPPGVDPRGRRAAGPRARLPAGRSGRAVRDRRARVGGPGRDRVRRRSGRAGFRDRAPLLVPPSVDAPSGRSTTRFATTSATGRVVLGHLGAGGPPTATPGAGGTLGSGVARRGHGRLARAAPGAAGRGRAAPTHHRERRPRPAGSARRVHPRCRAVVAGRTGPGRGPRPPRCRRAVSSAARAPRRGHPRGRGARALGGFAGVYPVLRALEERARSGAATSSPGWAPPVRPPRCGRPTPARSGARSAARPRTLVWRHRPGPALRRVAAVARDRRAARRAGRRVVVLADGELVAYLERGDAFVTFTDEASQTGPERS